MHFEPHGRFAEVLILNLNTFCSESKFFFKHLSLYQIIFHPLPDPSGFK